MKPSILFVDDEKNILQGLRRMLRGLRDEWEMDFAEGGEAALAKLSEQSVDVVVTDMKMPGMNGAELLDRVSELYPQTLRLILSGEADTEATFRTVRTSHQFLPKPSNSERLIEIIRSALQRRDAIGDAKLQALVTSVGCLPVSQATHRQLTDLLDEETASLDLAADVFSVEPALAAKVMQLANSAYFGIGDPAVSPKAAATRLGWDVLRTLLLNHELALPYPADACKAIYERSVAQAQETAELAAWIAKQEDAAAADVAQAQLAGLLHCLGRLLLCHQAPEDYAKVPALVTAGQMVDEAEHQVFGSHHAALGAYLAQAWALPPAVVDAIQHLHEPSNLAADEDRGIPLLAAHAALGIVTSQHAVDPKAAASAQLDADFVARQGCEAKVDAWVDGWINRGTAA